MQYHITSYSDDEDMKSLVEQSKLLLCSQIQYGGIIYEVYRKNKYSAPHSRIKKS